MRVFLRSCCRWMTAACWIAAGGALATEAHTLPNGWGIECVGRLQLALPLDVEVATTSAAKMESLFGLSRAEGLPSFSFRDGEVAGYSRLLYSGSLHVSDAMPKEGVQRLLTEHQKANLNEVRRRYAGRASPDGKTYSLAPVALNASGVSAYQFYGSHFDIAAEVGDRVVRTTADTGSSS